jgi:hypothetical protein
MILKGGINVWSLTSFKTVTKFEVQSYRLMYKSLDNKIWRTHGIVSKIWLEKWDKKSVTRWYFVFDKKRKMIWHHCWQLQIDICSENQLLLSPPPLKKSQSFRKLFFRSVEKVMYLCATFFCLQGRFFSSMNSLLKQKSFKDFCPQI